MRRSVLDTNRCDDGDEYLREGHTDPAMRDTLVPI